MTNLPITLQPWSLWLNLFPPELANTVGDLLLQLDPHVGKISTSSLLTGPEPEGLGNIVKRGHFERMLVSEWMYIDAAPLEFLRRAGSNELLFNGPEPAIKRGSQQCVALFDSGPFQLGEPRLAQLAMFILLARRAQAFGAEFLWGIWQKPEPLRTDVGLEGLRQFIRSRHIQPPPNDVVERWDALLGEEVHECWVIGAKGPVPRLSKQRVFIRRSLLAPELHVEICQRQTHRMVKLNLPDTSNSIRLLRKPFLPLASVGNLHHAAMRPSRTQAPRFSLGGEIICLPQLQGGAINYRVPQSTKHKPSKPRVQPEPKQGKIIAAGVYKMNLSYIAIVGDQLAFHGFPSSFFGGKTIYSPRPEVSDFCVPPGLAKWLPIYFARYKNSYSSRERVVLVDTKQKLVCWEIAVSGSDRIEDHQRGVLQFRHVLDDVIGVKQVSNDLYIAQKNDKGIQLYRWYSGAEKPTKTSQIDVAGDIVYFGRSTTQAGGDLSLAMCARIDKQRWWVGTLRDGKYCELEENAVVLGVGLSTKNPNPGLIVLHPNRHRIELRLQALRYELIVSTEQIQQASFEPHSGHIAWITARSCTTVVQKIDELVPLLQITCEGGIDAS